MLYPVRIVTCQSKCIVLATSVARWVWPKSAKWCHKKLLDSPKGLVTNFQLKSTRSSEILFKNMSFLTWLKETYKVIQNNNFSSCAGSQLASAENAGLGQHTFRPTIFYQSTFWLFEQRNCSLPRFFVWHTVLDDLFQMVAYLYAVEQCSTTNNLSIASALQPVVILEWKKWGVGALRGQRKIKGGNINIYLAWWFFIVLKIKLLYD